MTARMTPEHTYVTSSILLTARSIKALNDLYVRFHAFVWLFRGTSGVWEAPQVLNGREAAPQFSKS